MKHIKDEELISEIHRRLNEYNQALNDLKMLTHKLEAVNLKLQDSESTKSNFLSNIRNEINNPLTSIMGLSRQLASKDLKGSDVLVVSENIFHEAFELDFQLNNIFIAAEIEAGESSMGISMVEVESFVSKIITSFAHKIQAKSLEVEFVCEDGADFIFKTDPIKLRTILINIFANAVEFSFEDKKIKINAVRKGDMLAISISDEGVGIVNEERERIFDRFKQLCAGSQKAHKGHGLGLSVVKSLLNQLGGHIDLSGAEGEGSTFTISVPEFQGESEVDVYSEEGNEFIFGKEEEF